MALSDRFYYLDKNYNAQYRFVYDTKDKSVELIDVTKKGDLLIGNDFDGKFKINLIQYKLKTLYSMDFSLGGSFDKSLCRYALNGVDFELRLNINSVFSVAYLNAHCVDIVLHARRHSKDFLYVYGDIFTVGNFAVYFRIPDLMFEYILNLYNRHDFNGIMSSLYNLLGSNINILVSNFDNRPEVSFVGWL